MSATSAGTVLARGSDVRWITTVPAEQATLDRWCAGVGPTARLRAPRTDGVSNAPIVSSLTVLTWNTHVGGGDIVGLVNDLRAGRLTKGVPVEHFVLLLQEVHRSGESVPDTRAAAVPKPIHTRPTSGQRMDVVATARELGLELFYVPSMANGRTLHGLPEDRGNAILSTLPLDAHTAIELPFENQRRVAAAATVSAVASDGTPFTMRLLSVHLDNRSRPSRLLHSLGAARTRQARALVAAIGDDSATVLGGDLNTWSLSGLEGAVKVLQQRFAHASAHPTEPTFASHGLRLDRLMYALPAAAAVETRRLDDRRGSDHHPLLGTIRLAGQLSAIQR